MAMPTDYIIYVFATVAVGTKTNMIRSQGG